MINLSKRVVAGISAAPLFVFSPLLLSAQGLPVPVDGAIEAMKPGQFLRAPDITPEGPVTVIISLETQRAFVYCNGVPIGVSTVSTGKTGTETLPQPSGLVRRCLSPVNLWRVATPACG